MRIFTNSDHFHIQGRDFSYVIGISRAGHLLHLHYGAKLPENLLIDNLMPETTIPSGCITSYTNKLADYTLELQPLEFPGCGKGDYRSPAYQLIDSNGSTTFDFLVIGSSVSDKIISPEGMPSANGNGKTLVINLKDNASELYLNLYYSIVDGSDTIIRFAKLSNKSTENIKIERFLSSSFDFECGDFDYITLDGAWIRERSIHRRKVTEGEHFISSRRGISSAQHSPFMAICKPETTEETGDAWANLFIYSGNHKTSVELSSHGLTRVQQGINPENFCWILKPNSNFDSPAVALFYSNSGLNGLSNNSHNFIKEHIVRGKWQKRSRPVLANNWEATYFNFNEKKLIQLASEAASVGVELFVLDDGWFGKRNDDKSSLGDWYVNKKKLPSGIHGLSKKIRKKGLDFGIWVEPEMISVDSELYRNRPEWLMKSPEREPSPGRFQFLLDLTNQEVCDYLIKVLSELFSSAEISYVKWDMNRSFSDQFSKILPSIQQQETAHRYVLGLYYILESLTNKFPDILFESCSSGGGRFDPAMMAFMPQVWTSDNTDAQERVSIQKGSSFWAPQSVMGAHVSAVPNHQVLRWSCIESRFNTAAFGLLGYELDFSKLTPEEKRIAKKQIDFYKEHREILQFGTFKRIELDSTGNKTAWTVISKDKSKAIVGYYQKNAEPNPGFERIIVSGLKNDVNYKITNRRQYQDLKSFGTLINDTLPVDLKPGSLMHKMVTDKISLEVEKSNFTLPGTLLATRGFRPHRQFFGTGADENLAMIRDFGSRIFIIEEVKNV